MPRQKLNQIVNEEDDQFSCLTPEEARQIAKDSISAFFKNRTFKWGGPIPEHILHSDVNIDKVLNTSIADGVDQVYYAIHKAEQDCPPERVLAVLDECSKKWISKELAAGIMIMYFRLCEGIKFEV